MTRVLFCVSLVSLSVGFVVSCNTLLHQPELIVLAPHETGNHTPWSEKIRLWQERQRIYEERYNTPGVESPYERIPRRRTQDRENENLFSLFLAFRNTEKRRLAHTIIAWVKKQVRPFYIPDGKTDYWPTLDEVLRTNGDDCDGLELITRQLLLDFGWSKNELLRGIIAKRGSATEHHLVTLWFEDAEDPWVLDPTGAATEYMKRFSELRGWRIVSGFTDTNEYTPKMGCGARR